MKVFLAAVGVTVTILSYLGGSHPLAIIGAVYFAAACVCHHIDLAAAPKPEGE